MHVTYLCALPDAMLLPLRSNKPLALWADELDERVTYLVVDVPTFSEIVECVSLAVRKNARHGPHKHVQNPHTQSLPEFPPGHPQYDLPHLRKETQD